MNVSVYGIIKSMKHISFRLVSPKDLISAPEGSGDAIWDSEKEDFISTATHQLRSPLVGMKWTLDMLIQGEAGKISADQKSWLKAAYTSNERVISMVDSMLNAMRIEAGEVKFTKTEIDINVLMKDLVEELIPAAKEKKIDVSMDFDETIYPIQGDEEKLRVAFQNLVHNAIKYTPDNGEVSIKITKEEGNVKIVIKDTGIGIPPDERKDMFRRFFRGSNAMLSDTNGTGLGLYITKNVVERHNGQIWFETEMDKGTTFYIAMPFDGLQQ